MKLKRITLVFENCEVVDIPSEMVTYMLISGVSTTQIYNGGGEVETMMECSDCEIHILKAAGDLPMEWSVDADGNPATLSVRLEHNDITVVELDYGHQVDVYHVNWKAGNDVFNENMSVTDEDDEIRISIS